MEVLRSSGGQLNVTLTIAAMMFTSSGVSFNTRAYNHQIPGPSLEVMPGDTLRITLINGLEATPSRRLESIHCALDNCTALMGSTFSHLNTTNLHTHGLHVSPLLGSDDVLDVKLAPGERFEYTYKIPPDHVAGTFWYHPHKEGSTAMQVAGGAAGALIIRDPPGRSMPDWLRDMPERTLVLQQFPLSAMLGIHQYGKGGLFSVLDDAGLPEGWQAVEKANNQDGPQTNLPLLNGELGGTTTIRAGVWERWRFLNAGAFFFLDLTLEQNDSASHSPSSAVSTCDLRILAIDGIYISPMPRKASRVVLPPGGRVDAAVRCAAGHYRLASGAAPGASGAFSSDLIRARMIATIVATDDDPVPVVVSYPAAPSSVELAPFIPTRPTYLRDLRDEESPAHLLGAASEQPNAFNFTFQDVTLVDDARSPTAKLIYPLNGDQSGTCTFNGKTFASGTPLLQVGLGAVNTWACAGVQGHPLHMHVNPMQVISIDGAKPVDDGSDGTNPLMCDSDFKALCVGDWVDTLMIPNGPGDTAAAVVRWQAADFTGNVVLHCHYLPHEDQGCLTFVSIK